MNGVPYPHRSAITVFPARTDEERDFRIWNVHLISYAGYKLPDGTCRGDRGRIEFTQVVSKCKLCQVIALCRLQLL